MGQIGSYNARRRVDNESDWRKNAACSQAEPDQFFHGSTKKAKRLCAGCDVRAKCLQYALEHGERFGVWGGASERDRKRLTQKRMPLHAVAASAEEPPNEKAHNRRRTPVLSILLLYLADKPDTETPSIVKMATDLHIHRTQVYKAFTQGMRDGLVLAEKSSPVKYSRMVLTEAGLSRVAVLREAASAQVA